MTDLEKRIIHKVRDRLGVDLLEKTIIYLDHDLKRSGERLEVGDVVIDIPWDSHIVFVDLEPKVNWGHACKYILIRFDGNDVKEFAARMPPFMKADTSGFRLLWRGSHAPEWAVATNTR